MKKILMIVTVLSLATSIASIASASVHGWHHRLGHECVSSLFTRTSKTGTSVVKYLGGCVPGRKNRIERKVLEVSYWNGSYKRRAIVKDSFVRITWNSCSGANSSVNFEGGEYESDVHFDVENPNMNGEAARSFELVPMTDQEAADALDQARLHCEATLP